ncbi:MAG: hypothetical protein MJ248_04505 [Bacilli bacterium]|nr:hypothetical protein [Bacilli bacterium]
MKKAITVIISALYVIAIIIIAFFGSEVRTESKTTYVEDIVLVTKSFSIGDKPIYQVNPNPKWETDKEQVKYTIVIRDYNYFYTSMGNAIELKANVTPTNADHIGLVFSVVSGNLYSTITQSGEQIAAFSFDNKLENDTSAQVKIASTDGSLVSIKVGIVAIVTA